MHLEMHKGFQLYGLQARQAEEQRDRNNALLTSCTSLAISVKTFVSYQKT
jgi:hypothetical protein